MSGTDLGRQEKRRLCDLFAQRLIYPSNYCGGELLWRDSEKRPNILRPELYQHRHRGTGRNCPQFIRFAINFSVPWNYRRGFWGSSEPLDTSGPNYKIEITVLPNEAGALAGWLPLWLVYRENVNAKTLPDPPKGMMGLLHWLPQYRHVYFWSEAANKAYRAWAAEQEVLAACR